MERCLHDYIVFSEDFNLINSPAFYDCVVHLICTAGEGCFIYNEKTFSISKGMIVVLSQPRNVTVVGSGVGFACEYIAAPGKFLHNLLPANNYSIQGGVSLFSNPIIEVDECDARKFLNDIHNIRERVDDIEHRFYPEMIGSLLQTMVYELFDFHVKKNDSVLTTDRVGYITACFFALIEAGRPKTQREVASYAREMNVTPKYLSDTIKRVTGISVSEHINRAAVLMLIELLKDSRLSITQIADEMNFTSVSYFSRYCRKFLGVSPSRYRVAGAKD